ncbi:MULTISPECIES: SDR family NAD(P)-dependent oxidoreductase [Streptomyces]|uniref:SDR family oxidoreductase n=1 Tax=Streptomyces flaveolus TaxID=67297 RepID=A0ABV3AQ88_9ACTN|nr:MULTISPECIES: SDR family oxidoreductase [Streptomyces]KOG74189.1 hypothetical protein ADK77_06540 [Streptomyces antibioticus]
MNDLLHDKVAVITGAASGTGRAMALRFAEQGARGVVVADVRDTPREGGATTVDLVRQRGAEAVFVKTDITRRDDVRAAITEAEKLGGFDVYVNNAGVFQLEEDPLASEDEVFDRMMAINVKGTWIGAQEAIRTWLRRGEPGSLINISSAGGLRGSAHTPLYSASKGAVRLLSHSLAAKYGAQGIRVNAIHPGSVNTEMLRSNAAALSDAPQQPAPNIPIGRIAEPGEIADAAVYLASDLSSYVTGTSLSVDGGVTSTM